MAGPALGPDIRRGNYLDEVLQLDEDRAAFRRAQPVDERVDVEVLFTDAQVADAEITQSGEKMFGGMDVVGRDAGGEALDDLGRGGRHGEDRLDVRKADGGGDGRDEQTLVLQGHGVLSRLSGTLSPARRQVQGRNWFWNFVF